MEDAVWTINGETLEALGLTMVRGVFQSFGTSRMTLRRECDYDAAGGLAFGAAVTLELDGSPVFSGTVGAPEADASGDAEGQNFELVDAWQDLETTVYQEPWKQGGGTVMVPRAVIGLGYNDITHEWERITAGTQLRKIVEYAISVGVNIQAGAFPTGEYLIPTEVSNATCDELIRLILKLHPDWIPFLDHSTTPPTFNCVPSGTAGTVSLAVDGSGPVTDFKIAHRTDMLPDCVRICYELATTIDDEVYRNVVVDKFPAVSADSGPRTIQATIPLAGLQMQVQKSRVQTRTIPTEKGAEADAFLLAHFPALAGVDPDHYRTTAWELSLVDESADTLPDPISERAPALEVTEVADVPRELVRGTLEDWMRKRVATVQIDLSVRAHPAATKAEREIIFALPSAFTVTATDAITKIYKGITQWVAPEDVPTGIAQGTYEAIVAAMTYQGEVTLSDREIAGPTYQGRALNLTGGASGWATMKAPIHTVDWDVGSGTVTIGFGPIPALAPADFLELQRILRFRPTRWWSFAERGSDQIGATAAPSAAGDTVGGFHAPKTVPQARPADPDFPFKISTDLDPAAETPELRLYVSYAAASAMLWVEGDDTPVVRERPLKWDADNVLLNDPFVAGTVGYSVLAASTDYGVWMIVSGTPEMVTNSAANSGDADNIQQFRWNGTNSRVLVSDEYTEPTSVMPSLDEEAAFFLGTVMVDADLNATIAQYRRSDLVLPFSDMVRNINFP